MQTGGVNQVVLRNMVLYETVIILKVSTDIRYDGTYAILLVIPTVIIKSILHEIYN